MIQYTTTDADGDTYHVAVETDIERYGLPVVYPKYETFDYDDRLKWRSWAVAWQADSDTAHELVDLRSLHYEPPTDGELESIRERRQERERELWEKMHNGDIKIEHNTMTDDTTTFGTDADISFVGEESGEPIENIEINTDCIEDTFGDTDLGERAGEWHGSLTLTFDTDTVTCPNCNESNTVPADMLHASFFRDPTPCRNCGYPLL